MTNPRIKVVTRQIAVGQGGLMCSKIQGVSPAGTVAHFRFAFDCGSVNREHLRQGMDVLDLDKIDILFISHLDADHVNGIDLLLDRADVEMVVLPCLDPLSLTAIVCNGLNENGMPRAFQNFLLNPVGWFAERGVKRVMFVSRDAGGDGTLPYPADGPGPLDRGRLFEQAGHPPGASTLRIAVESQGGAPTPVKTAFGTLEAQTLSAAAAFEIDLGLQGDKTGKSLTWLLVPYYHQFPLDRTESFLSVVRKLMKIPPGEALATAAFSKRLLDMLSNEKSRNTLKNAYSLLSLDHNKTSLSLYSGPPTQSCADWSTDNRDWLRWSWHSLPERFVLPPFRGFNDLPGWMSTGDADLGSKGTREGWLKRFGPLLDTVGVFLLPHHGSNASLHRDVIERMQHAIGVACAAEGRKSHPHPTLVAHLRRRRVALWQVSEEQESEFSTIAVPHH